MTVHRNLQADSRAYIAEVQGQRRLIATAVFEDPLMKAIDPTAQDGEKLKLIVPVRDIPTDAIAVEEFDFTAVGGSSATVHRADVPQYFADQKRWSQTELRNWGGTAAKASVPTTGGTREEYLQQPGHNTPVYDVGALDAHGVGWAGGARVYVNGDRTSRPLALGEAIPFSSAQSGAGKDLIISFEAFAPGQTEFANFLTDDQKAKVIGDVKLELVSEFFPSGKLAVDYRGQGGIGRNNIEVAGLIAAPPQPLAPGAYPVVLRAGDQEAGRFVIDWQG